MPATYAHGQYGEKVLSLLDENSRKLIQKYRNLYDIGCSGPDILFFYRPFQSTSVRRIGYELHEKPAREFFMRARDLIQNSKNPDAALVYLLGFINHFVLDSECHPLVNEIENRTKVTHSEIESELDALMLRENGFDHVSTRVCDHIHVNQKDSEIIAPFFGISVKETVESLKTLKLFLNFFVAPSEMKRKLIFFVMRKTGMYDHYQGLVFNRVPNELIVKDVQNLREHVDLAVEASVALIHEFQRTLISRESLHERYDRNFD